MTTSRAPWRACSRRRKADSVYIALSEDRGLISPNQLYRDHYGIARLRRMLDVRAAWTDHPDLWLSLRTLFTLFQDDKLSAVLDLAPLNGELFATQTLDACTLSNRDLLASFWHLAYYQERAGAPSRFAATLPARMRLAAPWSRRCSTSAESTSS